MERFFGEDPGRFFGVAARPVSQIEMRRHPLSYAAYGVVAIVGLAFVFHQYGRFTEAQLFPGVSPWAIFAWKWMMVLGGLGCIVSLLVEPRPRPKWPDMADLLHIEAVFALVAAVGMLIYLVVQIHITGFSQGKITIGVFGLLIVGHLWRGIQCRRDARTLEALATAAEKAAQEVLDEAA